MTAAEYLKENSDWFDKSPGGEKLFFESEVIKMMENYSFQTEISDQEIKKGIKKEWNYLNYQDRHWMEAGAQWYREQLKTINK